MKTQLMRHVARLRPQDNIGAFAAVLLTAGIIAGWAVSTVSTTNASAVEDVSAFDTMRKDDKTKMPLDELKLGLVGSYEVTGADPDGTPYAGTGILDIALAPSGALELAWDKGRQVGIGQIVGNVLAVASSTKGRTAILVMTINPDGSLSGTWSRRTDRGYKGSEIWKRT
jgi:hypothetical protein